MECKSIKIAALTPTVSHRISSVETSSTWEAHLSEKLQPVMPEMLEDDPISAERKLSLFNFIKKRSRSQAASPKMRRQILDRAEGSCEVCRYPFAQILNIHHIYPVELGGVPLPWNLIALCPNCHALVHRFSRLKSSHPAKRVQYLMRVTGMSECEAVRICLLATKNASVNTYGQLEWTDNSRLSERVAQ